MIRIDRLGVSGLGEREQIGEVQARVSAGNPTLGPE